MDVNLTGALVTNVSLMQSSNTDYLPLWTQIITTVMTALLTLASVFLAQHLAAKSETRKHADEEKQKYYENRKRAYQEFLNIFSEPLPMISVNEEVDQFRKLTGVYLDAAMKAAEFGNIRLLRPIVNDSSEVPQYPTLLTKNVEGQIEERPLRTLEDFIEAILNVRLWKLEFNKKIEYLHAIRNIGSDDFGLLLLSTLMTPRIQTNEKSKKWYERWK